jgi:putative transposase
MRTTGGMAYEKPGPRHAAHALMPVEREAVKDYAGREATVDYSLQVLSIKGAAAGLFCLSASSVRSILMQEGLGQDRRNLCRQGARQKPNRPEELTGPNQCWCWDISYLKTDMLRVFWYLYVVLDEWSRKVVAWRVSNTLAMEQALGLVDDAIIAEGLLDVPEDKRPVVVNDNGKQMKAKPVQQMFVDLGMHQTFARPSTPVIIPLLRRYSARQREVRNIRDGSPSMMAQWCNSTSRDILVGTILIIIIHGSAM